MNGKNKHSIIIYQILNSKAPEQCNSAHTVLSYTATGTLYSSSGRTKLWEVTLT